MTWTPVKRIAKFAPIIMKTKVKVKPAQVKPSFVGGNGEGGVIVLKEWEKEYKLPPFLL